MLALVRARLVPAPAPVALLRHIPRLLAEPAAVSATHWKGARLAHQMSDSKSASSSPSPPLTPQALTLMIAYARSVTVLLTLYEQHTLALNPIHFNAMIERLSKHIDRDTPEVRAELGDARLVALFQHLVVVHRHFDTERSLEMLSQLTRFVHHSGHSSADNGISDVIAICAMRMIEQIAQRFQRDLPTTVTNSISLLSSLGVLYQKLIFLPEMPPLIDVLYRSLEEALRKKDVQLSKSDLSVLCRGLVRLQPHFDGSGCVMERDTDADSELEAPILDNSKRMELQSQSLDASLVTALFRHLLANPSQITQLSVPNLLLYLALAVHYPHCTEHTLVQHIGDALADHQRASAVHNTLTPRIYAQILQSFARLRFLHTRVLNRILGAMLVRMKRPDEKDFNAMYRQVAHSLLVAIATIPLHLHSRLTHEWFARTLRTLVKAADPRSPSATIHVMLAIVALRYESGPESLIGTVLRSMSTSEDTVELKHQHEQYRIYICRYLTESLNRLNTLFMEQGAAKFAPQDFYRLSQVINALRLSEASNDWKYPKLSEEFVVAMRRYASDYRRVHYSPPLIAAAVEQVLQSMGVQYQTQYEEPSTGELADFRIDVSSAALADSLDIDSRSAEVGAAVPVLMMVAESSVFTVGEKSTMWIPDFGMTLRNLHHSTDHCVLIIKDADWRAQRLDEDKQQFLRAKLAHAQQQYRAMKHKQHPARGLAGREREENIRVREQRSR